MKDVSEILDAWYILRDSYVFKIFNTIYYI